MEDLFSELDSLFEKDNALNKEIDDGFSNLDDQLKEYERMEEISHNFADYINDIDRQFAEKTGLTKTDIAFLAVATGLQLLRQAIFLKPRMGDKEASKEPHEKNQEFFDKNFEEKKATDSKKYYYASFGDILDVSRPVPYDVTYGSKEFNLGGDGGLGSNHRFKVPGHDPVLGLVYGTANIVTNTITSYYQVSAHVKYMPTSHGYAPTIYARAETLKVFYELVQRAKDDLKSVCAALVKQVYHIKADQYSHMGIPIPIIGIMSPELSQELASYGVDWINFKQAGLAGIIDLLIALIHRLIYDGPKTEIDLKLYKIRTKKILDYSGIIAETSNVIYVAVNAYLGNEGAIKRLDLGGITYLVGKLIYDHKFMSEVKKEFLDSELDKIVRGEVT